MKLIIDIDEEDREDIVNMHFVREELKFKIGKAIMNGTPPTATPEEIINCAEEALGNLAIILEKEHAHIVDEKGVEYSAGMIRSIVEVLKAVRTARRVPDGC